jgi:hypothetical protein
MKFFIAAALFLSVLSFLNCMELIHRTNEMEKQLLSNCVMIKDTSENLEKLVDVLNSRFH